MASGNGGKADGSSSKPESNSKGGSNQSSGRPSSKVNGAATAGDGTTGRNRSSQLGRPNAADALYEVFRKPADIYRNINQRHQFRPLFLRRNLSYMSVDAWLLSKSAAQPSLGQQKLESRPAPKPPTQGNASKPGRRARFDEITKKMLSLAEKIVGTPMSNTLANGTLKLVGLEGCSNGKFQVSFSLESRTAEKRKGRVTITTTQLGSLKLPLDDSSASSIVVEPEKAEKIGVGSGAKTVPAAATLVIRMERLDFDEPEAKRLRRLSDANGKERPDSNAEPKSVSVNASRGPVIWSNGLQSCHASVIPLAPPTASSYLDRESGLYLPPKPSSRFYEARLPFRDSRGLSLLQPGGYEVKLEPVDGEDTKDVGKEVSVVVLPSGRIGACPDIPGFKWKPAPEKPDRLKRMENRLRGRDAVVLKLEFAPMMESSVNAVENGGNCVVFVPARIPSSLFPKARRELTDADLGKKKMLAVAERRSKIMSEAPVCIYYHFSAEKKRLSSSFKRGFPLECVFCKAKSPTLYGLLKHCRLEHPRFIFHYVPLPSNEAKIDVSVNPNYDGSFTGNPSERVVVSSNGALCSRAEPRKCSASTIIFIGGRRFKGLRGHPKLSLAEFFAFPGDSSAPHLDANGQYLAYPVMAVVHQLGRSVTTGHRRLYFHSGTIQPALSEDGVGYSDDENDPEWLRKKTEYMIDDFTDVNEGEKAVMKAWNLHQLRHHFTGDCHMDEAVKMFTREKAAWIVEQELVRNFNCHLHSMLSYGLVKVSTILGAMQLIRSKRSQLRRAKEAKVQESTNGEAKPDDAGKEGEEKTEDVEMEDAEEGGQKDQNNPAGSA